MCLINAKRIFPGKGEDIVVYKILEKDWLHKDEYASPWQTQFHWRVGKEYSVPYVEPDIKHHEPLLGYHDGLDIRVTIHGHCFHSYVTKEDAFREARGFTNTHAHDLHIFEAVIPSDSLFVYLGVTRFGGPASYASQKLKIVKEIYPQYDEID